MNVVVEIVGMDALRARLDAISMGSARAMRLGSLKTCQRIERSAKIYCPVNTGYLRSSILAETLGEDGAMVSAGGSYRGTHGAMRDVQYATYVEFGTGIYAAGPGGSRAKKIPWVYNDGKGFHKTSGMRPSWFFTKAVENNMSWWPIDVHSEVEKLLNDSASGSVSSSGGGEIYA